MVTQSEQEVTTPAQLPSIHPDTAIGHIHLKVADLDRSVAFYRDAFGFNVMDRFGDSAAFLSAGGYHHHLGTNTWSPGPSARPDEARLLEWTLHVPSSADVDAVASSVTTAGYAATRDDDGSVRVGDPWGTVVRVR